MRTTTASTRQPKGERTPSSASSRARLADKRAEASQKAAALRAKLDQLWADALAVFEDDPARRLQVEALRSRADSYSSEVLYVAIMGVTSSGKSTLINALMGRSLLPEESRPTSNLEVRARRGARDEVRVHYLDGRDERLGAKGTELAAEIAALASEKQNPNNEKGVQFIEWTSRRASLPEGIVLLDTPGLDAYGHEDHAELTLSRILPMADIVIYMSSIRNPLKRADLEGLDRVVAHDQRVLVALNQIDLEVDSHEHGVLVKSAEEKLASHEARLRHDLKGMPRLRSCAEPVLISARLGKRAAGDQDALAWRQSGLAQMHALFERFATELETLPVAARARRLDARLRESARDISAALKSAKSKTEPGQETSEAERMRAEAERLSQQARAARSKARKRLLRVASPKQLSKQLLAPLETGMSVKEFQAAMRSARDTLKQSVKQVAEETRAADAIAVSTLAELGMQPPRRAVARRKLKPIAPQAAGEFIKTGSKKVRKHGWQWGLPPWPEYERRAFTRPNVNKAREHLRQQATAQSERLKEHIDWWTEHFNELYVAPLTAEAQRLQRRVEAFEELRREATQGRGKLKRARRQCRRIARRANALAAKAEASLRDFEPPPRAPSPPADAASPDRLEASFADDVANFLWEHAEARASGPLRVLLLGARREPRLRLLALLRGELASADTYADFEPHLWVTLCSPEGRTPKHHVTLDAPEALGGIELTIAPADAKLRPAPLHRLLESYDLVGVDVDVSRVGAGLSDLERAPYAGELSTAPERVFLYSADGALMRHRLSHLLTQVPDALEATAWADAPWLMHEDFDLRYTRFIELGGATLEAGESERALVRRWKNEDLSFEMPFTSQILRSSYVEASNSMKREDR